MEEKIDVENLNFHPILKDIENMFWFFYLSHSALANPNVQSILKSGEDKSVIPMLRKYNEWVNLQIKIDNNTHTSNSNILDSMIFIGKAMAILTYDFLSLSSYNNSINKDKEFQFLRHIRNGAAHNKKFNLKDKEGNWKIQESEIIGWNGMKINRELQGKSVFNNFVSLFGVFLLAKYFSERLKGIDQKK